MRPDAGTAAGPAVRTARLAAAVLLAGTVLPGGPGAAGAPAAGARPLPGTLYGVTVDDVGTLPAVVAGLRALPRTPTTRVVFDDGMPPASYAAAIDALRPSSYVLGQPFDSSALRAASPARYRARFAAYLRELGPKVDVWEVGNEVNGDWTGPYASVGAKVTDATGQVDAAGGRSALTLWYNDGCDNGPGELDPVAWSERYLSPATRARLDYVLVSYYEDRCGFRRPSAAAWTAYFARLHALYPNARIGFGELGYAEPVRGAAERDRVAALIRYYYGLRIDLPYYALGGFYWNYVQDMTPHAGNQLWSTLRATWSAAAPPRPPRPAARLVERWTGRSRGAWNDGGVHGAWRSEFDGHGRTGTDDGILGLAPARPASARDSHAALVLSGTRFGELDLTVRVQTVSQTRSGAYAGARPDPRERAWVVWHQADCLHFSYVVLRADGWEVGRADPGGRHLLRRGTDRAFPVGAWNTVRVRQHGDAIAVDVDGRPLTRFTDTGRAYRTGSVGLYAQDAAVRFGPVTVF